MRAPKKNKFRIKRGHPRELTPDWQRVYDALPDSTHKNAIQTGLYFLCRNDVAPHDVSDAHVDEIALFLEASGRGFAESIANSFVKYWNRLGLGLPKLSLRQTAQTRRQAAWEKQGEAIDSAIKAHIATRKASFKDGGRHEENALQAATQIVAHHRGTVSSLDDLLTREALKLIAQGTAPRKTIGTATRRMAMLGLRAYAKAQRELATDDPARQKALKTALNLLKSYLSELSPTSALPADTIDRLIPFDCTEAYDRLVQDCVAQVISFAETAQRKADLPNARGALASLLSFETMRKRERIAPLSFTGPQRRTERVIRPTLSDEIEHRLGTSTVTLLDQFYGAFITIVGRPPEFLFEKLSGGLIDQSALGKNVRRFLSLHGYDLRFSDLAALGIKFLIDSKCTPEAIADAAGRRTTANLRIQFRALLGGHAAQTFDEALDAD